MCRAGVVDIYYRLSRVTRALGCRVVDKESRVP
jgi:hypothetical protein